MSVTYDDYRVTYDSPYFTYDGVYIGSAGESRTITMCYVLKGAPDTLVNTRLRNITPVIRSTEVVTLLTG